MRPYQKEYIENIREIAALTARKDPDGLTLEAYEARMRRDEAAAWEKVGRNMALLREGLFSTLDHLFEADQETLEELAEGLGRRCPELSVRRLGGELLLSPVREWMRA